MHIVIKKKVRPVLGDTLKNALEEAIKAVEQLKEKYPNVIDSDIEVTLED